MNLLVALKGLVTVLTFISLWQLASLSSMLLKGLMHPVFRWRYFSGVLFIFIPVMKEPDSRIRLYARFVLPLMA